MMTNIETLQQNITAIQTDVDKLQTYDLESLDTHKKTEVENLKKETQQKINDLKKQITTLKDSPSLTEQQKKELENIETQLQTELEPALRSFEQEWVTLYQEVTADIYETSIDTTRAEIATTISDNQNVKKELEALGSTNELTNHDEQKFLDVIDNQSNKTLEELAADPDEYDKIIGSVMGSLSATHGIPDIIQYALEKSTNNFTTPVDQDRLDQWLGDLPYNDIASLQQSMAQIDPNYTNDKILSFLFNDQSVLAKDIRTHIFPEIVTNVYNQENIAAMVEQYNALHEDASEDELEDKSWLGNYFDKLLSGKEWKENSGKNIGRLVGGAAVGIGGGRLVSKIVGLFGGKKESADEDSSSSWRSKIKKFGLIAGGVGIGGLLIGKIVGFDKVKKRWNDILAFLGIETDEGGNEDNETDDTNEETANEPDDIGESVEELDEDPEVREKYNKIGDSVNDFYEEVLGIELEELGGEAYEGGYAGAAVHLLDNTHDNVGEILQESTIYEQLEKYDDNMFYDMRQRGLINAEERALGLLENTLALIPEADGIPVLDVADKAVDGWEDKVKNRIEKVKNNETILGAKDQIFRKTIKVVSYLHYVQEELKVKIAQQYLAANDEEYQQLTSQEDKDLYAQHKIGDEDFVQTHVGPILQKEFLDKNLVIKDGEGAMSCMEKYDVLIPEIVAADVKEELAENNEQKAERIDVLQDMIQREQIDTDILEDMTTEYMEEVAGIGKRRFGQAMLGGLKAFIDTDQIDLDTLEDGGVYSKLFAGYIAPAKTIHTKISSGEKVTMQDLEDMQDAVTKYHALQQELILHTNTLQSLKETEDGYWLSSLVGIDMSFVPRALHHWFNDIAGSAGQLTTGIRMLFSKDTLGSGALKVAGGFVALDFLTLPARQAAGMMSKVPYIGGLAKLAKKSTRISPAKYALKWSGGWAYREIRPHMAKIMTLGNRRLSPSSLLYKGEKALQYLKYDILTGKIPLEKGLKLAQWKKIKYGTDTLIQNTGELIEKLTDGRIKGDDADLLARHRKNTKLRNKILTSNRNIIARARGKITSLRTVHIDKTLLSKLRTIDQTLRDVGKLDDTGKWTDDFRRAFMENTKKLDKVDDLLKTSSQTDSAIAKLLQVSDDIPHSQLGKIIGKNYHHIDDLDEVVKFLGRPDIKAMLQKNPAVFVQNTLRNRSKMRGLSATKQLEVAKSLKLTQSRKHVAIEKMKKSMSGLKQGLIRLKARSPYAARIGQKISQLDKLIKINPQTYEALGMNFGKFAWMETLGTKSIKQLTTLSQLLSAKGAASVRTALSKAKSTAEVRTILTNFAKKHNIIGQSQALAMPDELLGKVAKMKGGQKIAHFIKYTSQYKELGKVMQIMKSPGMRMVGRFVSKALPFAASAFEGFMAYNQLQEAQKIKVYNPERGEFVESEAMFNAAMAGGMLLCVFIPGPGRVALAAAGVAMLTQQLGNVYYETMDKYHKNRQDFLTETALMVKQHIVSVHNGSQHIDRSWKEGFTDMLSSADFEALADKSSDDALEALIYFDELKKNPLAAEHVNLNNGERMKELKKAYGIEDIETYIADANKAVNAAVEKRYNYLTSKIGTTKVDGEQHIDLQKLDKKSHFADSKGISLIDALLNESELYASNPEFYGNSPAGFEAKKESLQKEVAALPKATKERLDTLRNSNQSQLLIAFHGSGPFVLHMQQDGYIDGERDPEYDNILANQEVLNTYMTYKSMQTGVDILYDKYASVQDTIDFHMVRQFLIDFTIMGGAYTKEDLANIENPEKNITLLSQAEVQKQLNVTTNPLQNALYRISTEVVGESIPNDIESIKRVLSPDRDDRHGLYIEDDEIVVNDHGILQIGWDTEFDLWDAAYNIDALKEIRDAIEESASEEDLIDQGSGDESLNNEIATKYTDIFDNEIEILENRVDITADIVERLKADSRAQGGKYVRMSMADVMLSTKIGYPDAGQYLYRIDENDDLERIGYNETTKKREVVDR